MSWPQWQPPAQPAMPMMNAPMPMGIQYSPEQWQQMQQQNWQQWAQWQQQYQQWHQQYGAEYQKSLSAMANLGTNPLMNTAAPPPLPNDAKPPPPPDEPVQPLQPPSQNQQINANKNFQTNPNPKPPYNYNSTSETNSSWVPPANNQNQQNYNTNYNNQHQNRPHQGKRQALEHHTDVTSKKNKLDWQPPSNQNKNSNVSQATLAALDGRQFGPQLAQTSSGPAPQPENPEDLSDPEKKFMKQFAEWEAQFNKWKEQNQDHPDKVQYREYEKKWEAWRNQLLDRRELMRKKRLGLIPANVNINTSLDMKSNFNADATNANASTNIRSSLEINSLNTGNVGGVEATTESINPINSKALATLFKTNLNDGIPGLDLVDAPGQPDEVPTNESDVAGGDGKDAESKNEPALNLDMLSKNLNSILGDQKLLSMLSLVAQSTNVGAGQKTEGQSSVPSTPSGITLAPKIVQDDQSSNWSMNTNNSGNSTSWSQNQNNQNTNKEPFEQNQRFGMNQPPNFGRNDTEFGQNQNERSFPMNERDLSKNRFEDYDRYDRMDDRFPRNNQNSNFEDNYWSPNGQNVRRPGSVVSGISGAHDDMGIVAPAPPTIASFDELLHIDKIVDYEHKHKKQDTTDVRVFTPRLFDYRHKLVTRIPLPERPKWLTETFRRIPEFDPPITRNVPLFSRHAPERYPVSQHPPPPLMGMPPPSGAHGGHFNDFNDMNTFSRRAPPNQMSGGSNLKDFDRPARPGSSGNDYNDFRGRNNDDYERFKRPNWRDDYDRCDDRERDRDRDRNRREVDRSRENDRTDRNKDFASNRDVKNDYPTNLNAKKDGFDSSFSQNQQLFSAALKMDESRVSQSVRTNIDDLLNMPGRAKRPPRIVIILRGPPGSGKTFLAKQIKDKETENGGSAPRILSLDDYFMVEQEKEVIEDGKTVKVKEMVYEYEECMEAIYRQSLLKTFKKTITDGYFPFIIVDNVNDKVKYFDGMWSFAKQNGFQVYICQLDLDVQICTKRNTHGRSEVEIQHIVNGWEEIPSHYGVLDATNLIQAGSIPEVEMEEIDSPNDVFDDDDEENEEQACSSSKWDNFECSIDNLAKLDGINKPLRSAGTMEDYLQLDEWPANRPESKPGQKRVRWADLEERKQQDKMRAIGFVVGQTDWGRMMDPTQGGSALTKTKYIERVGVRKVNSN